MSSQYYATAISLFRRSWHATRRVRLFLQQHYVEILAFIWPVIFLHRYLIGSVGGRYSLTISNDFLLYYVYKPYLLDFYAQLRMPIWSPTEAAGFSLIGSALAQPFYPPTILLVGFYRVVGGFSSFDYHWYTILHVCLFSLGIVIWLRRQLGLSARAALFAALIIAVSFKMTDILRFPNAVFSVAWYPWILIGLTLCTRKGFALVGWLVTIASTLNLCTAGYPYFIIYALFLIGPYLLIVSYGPTRGVISLNEGVPGGGFLKNLVVGTSALTIGGLASLPWLLEVRQILSFTAARSTADYDFATKYSYSPLQTLGAYVFPPVGNPEGWVYFGTLSLFIISFFVVIVLHRPKTRSEDFWLIVLSACWIATVTGMTLGRYSYLFDMVWSTFPFLQGLRIWGRLNIVLLPVFALLLARAWQVFETQLISPSDLSRSCKFALYSFMALVVAVQLGLLFGATFDYYWLHYAVAQLGPAWWYPLMGVVSALTMAFFMSTAVRRKISIRPAAFLIVCVGVITVDIWPESSTQWAARYPDRYSTRVTHPIADQVSAGFTAPRRSVYGAIWPEYLPSFNLGVVSAWYSEGYVRFYNRYFNGDASVRPDLPAEERAALETFLGIRDGSRLFLTRTLDHPTIASFLADAREVEQSSRITVERYDGTELRVRITAGEPLILSFVDNWLPGWNATVNDKRRTIELLFGTFKALRVDPGENEVRFTYRPEMLKYFSATP
ncbi:hypothetical protein JQ597_27485 [Bradyrhizobium sp. AUGA SZCCT0177]|uniref:hypothetical protein n=1 Tax=Bradyrhizobium sp. AUGA SZCCT0177 TaxID=2807665 RepID=UPI001BACEF75|nr:hypothetical protein [Bradyrhizobium sp. AUGA SZCCT0177]MBR1285799.1 hypothetical protein [Bradyrhizobium sp. AUGA SZCCT0177]